MNDAPHVRTIERDNAIDVTRGIAIALVVLFHMTRGFAAAGWLTPGAVLKFADGFAYSFHVHIFLLIAGYLSFPRAAQGSFQLQRQCWLYQAYLLWSFASWLLTAAAVNAVNNPVSGRDLLWLPIVPIQHFWFLPALMLGTAMIGLLRTPAALIAGGIAIFLLIPLCEGLPSPLGTLNFVIMVMIGGGLQLTGFRPRPNMALAILCLAVVGIAVWWKQYLAHGAHIFPPLGVLIALCGCYAAYTAACVTGSGALNRALAYLGQHSLVIYLLHIIAGSGMRVMIEQLAPAFPLALAMPLVFAISVCGPLLFESVTQRIGLDDWLGLRPLLFTRRASAPSAPVPSL